MEIVADYPPNWEKLKSHFDIEGAPIVITYGDKIYNPGNYELQDHLIAHEEVHSRQQREHPGGKDAYVDRFIEDSAFRLEVEIEAYIEQLRYIKKHKGRNVAPQYLPIFAKHLSSEIYGHMISTGDATMRLLAYLWP